MHEDSLVNVSGRSVNTPCFDCRKLAFRGRMPPTRAAICGAVSVNIKAQSSSRLSGGKPSHPEVVAEPVGGRFEHRERLHVGLLLRDVRAPRRERDRSFVPTAACWNCVSQCVSRCASCAWRGCPLEHILIALAASTYMSRTTRSIFAGLSLGALMSVAVPACAQHGVLGTSARKPQFRLNSRQPIVACRGAMPASYSSPERDDVGRDNNAEGEK
jgi:hypothetical protein